MTTTPPGGLRSRNFALGLTVGAVQAVLVMLITGSRLGVGTEDTDLYYRYASLMRQGRIPYRDFLVEYPLLALPFLLGPSAAGARGVVAYKFAFAGEMLLCNAVAVGLVAWWVGRHEGSDRVPARLAWTTLVVLILSRLMVTRYDAAPMLVGFAATLAWSSGRAVLGGGTAACGAALKIYPAAAALVALIADRARPRGERSRGSVAFTITAAGLVLVWWALGGSRGVAESVRFQTGRGFEYGSLASGAQLLAARLVRAPITIARDHSSFSTITPWSESLLPWVLPLQAAAILSVGVVFARRGLRDGIRYQGAAVLAFIAAGKVFSPQFLIWLIPYLAVLAGPVARRARWLFVATCATTLLAPGLFRFVPRTSLWVILAYNGRNVLVVWLLIWLVWGPLAPRVDPAKADEAAG